MRMPKLLHPNPMTETLRPELPMFRYSMFDLVPAISTPRSYQFHRPGEADGEYPPFELQAEEWSSVRVLTRPALHRPGVSGIDQNESVRRIDTEDPRRRL